MIGLIFLLILIFWVLFSIYIGKEIPVWCKMKHPKIMALICIPLVFFLPVADEIIAYPQMMALCDQGGYELAVSESYAKGKVIYNNSFLEEIILFPSVKVQRMRISYLDSKTNEEIIKGYGFIDPLYGFLSVPAGSSGNKMTLLLKTCSIKNIEVRDNNRIPIRFKHLNFTISN